MRGAADLRNKRIPARGRRRRGSTGIIAAAALSCAALLTSAPQTGAATLYWDVNGSNPGAGTTPSGTWDGFTENWNLSSDGGSQMAFPLWTSGDTAIFSAGTDASGPFTVTLNGTQTIGGMTVEEGLLNLTGTSGSALAVG